MYVRRRATFCDAVCGPISSRSRFNLKDLSVVQVNEKTVAIHLQVKPMYFLARAGFAVRIFFIFGLFSKQADYALTCATYLQHSDTKPRLNQFRCLRSWRSR